MYINVSLVHWLLAFTSKFGVCVEGNLDQYGDTYCMAEV